MSKGLGSVDLLVSIGTGSWFPRENFLHKYNSLCDWSTQANQEESLIQSIKNIGAGVKDLAHISELFRIIIGLATGTETTHNIITLLLPKTISYLRLNPAIGVEVTLDETSPQKLIDMRYYAVSDLTNYYEKFQSLLSHFK